ncbi:predicted protein [Thalassiosira pseudonana CCMP1335]|uniref:Glycosyl transferase CAP10 domain-containing protein n=1 Tax=Thalassiosira pseudonana TaxID=35128 RepID=B8CBF6_THAPS|nr:predicted protein [Thalassiosira pseudonana CCMP1335]EED89120.1 predicted protein [Thalassiosira pseudonana CCMP1335]|eukprot:scaffold3521_cov195-Alexandrium_tamarense.AAC.1
MDIKPSDKSLMPQDDFQKYKAILDIDCNAWWSARLGKLLCYNSIVIKPIDVGYWEKEIQPNVHYLPVAAGPDDLETKVRDVIDPANSEEMKQINTNSQAFRRTKLTIEQYTLDVLWTLLPYAELVKSSPDFNDV